ncbi:hypothetical protein [Azospirillum canadense]|uniref:hypothetical protein n=1 Tax=Azospirillum canadense TaxID=403962 RepID=UPI002225BE1D|nr:hypothetical protein [Azospirillum canadense]MCW2239238.1 hypothetical protein [Azospirillum canadense]
MTGTARDNGNKGNAMARTRLATASYHPQGDVLYIDVGPSQHSFCEPGADGILRRYSAEEGLPNGVTVIDFGQAWAKRRPELLGKVAGFLGVPADEIERSIAQALSVAR